MTESVYGVIYTPRAWVVGWTCDVCGGLVAEPDREKHTSWHDQLNVAFGGAL